MRVLAAPDKFKGTATAAEVAAAICAGVHDVGGECVTLPVADGGDGTLAAFGGANRWTTVTGPLGEPVNAGWRLDDGGRAVVEMAEASGLALVGGASGNDPMKATTRGTGELIAAALHASPTRVLVGVGGSAATDGGLGAVEVLRDRWPLDIVTVCCDVRTPFRDAARVFAAQKGASPDQVVELTARLDELAERFQREFAVDVTNLRGAGAAGGLAGGLAALGARLVPGFDVIADELGLRDAIASSDLVITGEGKLDATSFDGKAVGGVVDMAQRHGVPVFVVAGTVDGAVRDRVEAHSLTEEWGDRTAMSHPTTCVREVVTRLLRD